MGYRDESRKSWDLDVLCFLPMRMKAPQALLQAWRWRAGVATRGRHRKWLSGVHGIYTCHNNGGAAGRFFASWNIAKAREMAQGGNASSIVLGRMVERLEEVYYSAWFTRRVGRFSAVDKVGASRAPTPGLTANETIAGGVANRM